MEVYGYIPEHKLVYTIIVNGIKVRKWGKSTYKITVLNNNASMCQESNNLFQQNPNSTMNSLPSAPDIHS